MQLEEDFDGARRIDLDTTYRSTRNILEAANALIQPKVANRARDRLRAPARTSQATLAGCGGLRSSSRVASARGVVGAEPTPPLSPVGFPLP